MHITLQTPLLDPVLIDVSFTTSSVDTVQTPLLDPVFSNVSFMLAGTKTNSL
jgi:hypothetical protein